VIPSPLSGTPYGTAFILFVAVSALCWILSLLTGEFSWVDRLWSLIPPAYCLIVAADLDFRSARVNIMTALVLMWGVRLTANFAVKGGYRPGGEDYRWAYLRGKLGKLQFQLLNVTFVCPGQMGLIWLFTSPIHQAWRYSGQPIGWLDYLAIVAFVVFLAGESVADAQMWRFQKNKRRLRDRGLAVEKPFIDEGLYRLSRHPNYFCEMGMWVTFYLFAISASNQVVHWTGLGFLLLIALFHGSINLTEEISGGKYPGYSEYRATVPRVVPIPLRKLVGR
jgi:steroid 5-alpha reductase family enzyme